MAKNKIKDIITKDNKYEEYVLLILSIISIILGPLVLFDIIKLDKDVIAEPKVLASVILALGVFCLLLSIRKIKKRYIESKRPVSKAYLQIQKFDKENDSTIPSLLMNYGFELYIDEGNGLIEIDGSYWFVLSKSECDVSLILSKDSVVCEMCISDKLEDKLSEEFYDYDGEIFVKKYELNETSSFESLLNIVSLYYEEHYPLMKERIEKFLNKQ